MSIRGSRCTALIHPFASEPSGSGWSYCSPFKQKSVLETSADVHLPADSHTRSVRWPTLLRASALKEHFFKRATQWSRLFKDVFRNVTTRVLRCSPDDRMSIAASEGELSLSGYDDSAALSPSGVVALSEPDPEMTAMLFPGPPRMSGSCGILHRVRFFEPAWLVSWWRLRWFSVPPFGAILPGSAWAVYKLWKTPFTAQTNLGAPPPYHPRWWSFGVHGHPLGGADCGHATVSNSRYRSAGWSVSPLTDLFVRQV